MGKILITVFIIGSLSANLILPLCWGASEELANPAITLDIKNGTLRSALGRISHATGWKISAPDKWLGKPVNQTLNQASMEEGLRSILNSAGIENLLLRYDEGLRVVTIYDTEIAQGRSSNRPWVMVDQQVQSAPADSAPVHVNAGTPGVSATYEPILSHPSGNTGSGPPGKFGRRTRRNTAEEE